MSISAVQELIAKQALDRELISHFLDFSEGEVTLRFESEYWDYKRELFDLNDIKSVAELAKDVLAFHNTHGGYIICGITKEYVVLGVHESTAVAVDSNRLNEKLRRYIGDSFRCRYAALPLAIGGARKILSVIFVPQRKGVAVRAKNKSPIFDEGDLFLRVNDRNKTAQTDPEFLQLYSPPEPEVIVGSHQLKTYSPRDGVRLFMGDYGDTGFVGDTTRRPLVQKITDELIFGKWDVALLRGVGGVGKTAVAIEATRKLALEDEYKNQFGGIISLSAKSEQLTPYDRSNITPEIGSYDQFLRQILANCVWEGDMPEDTAGRECLARKLIKDQRILLFIDNFETIETRETRIADFIRNLDQGTRALLTSRHLPQDLPALAIDVPPMERREAEILALAEAAAQHVDPSTTDRFLNEILEVSAKIPLAIKWIISCSKNAEHLMQLMEDHRRGKPALANLCEFCFTFEYNLLSTAAKTALVLFPLFRSAPTSRELAIAAGLDGDVMQAALDELVGFSLVIREFSPARDQTLYRVLKLTESFAASRLCHFGDLDRQARRRLKEFYGISIPQLLEGAAEMVEKGATVAARKLIEDEVLDREPSNTKAIYLRARTFEKEFQYTSAIKDYERALELSSNRDSMNAEIALRMIPLLKIEPQHTREDLIPILEKAYLSFASPELGVEIAKIFDILGKNAEAIMYYGKVFKDFSPNRRDLWEEAFVAICSHLKQEDPKRALDFVREAQSICSDSRVVSRWERNLMEELGLVRYTHSKPQA